MQHDNGMNQLVRTMQYASTFLKLPMDERQLHFGIFTMDQLFKRQILLK